jgi:hypothetical protein
VNKLSLKQAVLFGFGYIVLVVAPVTAASTGFLWRFLDRVSRACISPTTASIKPGAWPVKHILRHGIICCSAALSLAMLHSHINVDMSKVKPKICSKNHLTTAPPSCDVHQQMCRMRCLNHLSVAGSNSFNSVPASAVPASAVPEPAKRIGNAARTTVAIHASNLLLQV